MARSVREQNQRIALCGLLVSLMLVLGYVETLIPIPIGVPGVKLGLSLSLIHI